MEMIETARQVVEQIRAERQATREIKSNIPPAAKYVLKSGDEVLAYSERDGIWVSVLRIVDIDGKHAWISTRQSVLN